LEIIKVDLVVMGAVLGKKKKAREASATSGTPGRGRRRMRLWLPSPKLKRFAQTDIPSNASPVNLRRIEDNEEVTKMSFFPPYELIGLGSPVLDIV
jgi:hypothetical protein